MELILEYFIYVTPGLVIAGILFWFFRNSHKLIHIVLFITVFIFTRDAMTQFGLWQIGGEGFFWIRWIADPLILVILGLSSLSFVLLMQKISPDLAKGVVFFRGKKIQAVMYGILGAIIVALPIVIYQITLVPIGDRGGTVPLSLLPFILLVTVFGNFYEEILFRGYAYSYFTDDEKMPPLKAAVLSGALFSFGHIFLAFNVTTVGLPILIFAFWEGSIAGIVRSKFGVIPATLTHGLAICILTSGLF